MGSRDNKRDGDQIYPMIDPTNLKGYVRFMGYIYICYIYIYVWIFFKGVGSTTNQIRRDEKRS